MGYDDTIHSSGNLHFDVAASVTTTYLNGGSLSGHGSISGSVVSGGGAHTIPVPEPLTAGLLGLGLCSLLLRRKRQ